MNLFSIWLKELKSFFSIWREELNLSCFPIWLKELNFFKMLKELNLSSLWITFLHDSNWTLFWWIVSQLSHDAFTCHALPSNCVESKKSRIFHKKWLKVLNTFLNLTDWKSSTFSALDSKNWTFFQPFDSKNWALFCMSPKLNFFFEKKYHPKKWLKELNLFETWLTESNPFETKKTQRIEPSFVFFFFSMTQRIELFVNDSLNWASFLNLFSIRVEFFFFWLKELNFFWIWLKESNPFFECDFFSKKKKLKKFNSFQKKKMTQIIEPFWTWLNELNLL